MHLKLMVQDMKILAAMHIKTDLSTLHGKSSQFLPCISSTENPFEFLNIDFNLDRLA